MTRRAFFALAWVVPTQRFSKLFAYAGPITWIVPSPPRDPCMQPGCPDVACHGPGVDFPFCTYHAELRARIREATRRGIKSGRLAVVINDYTGRR